MIKNKDFYILLFGRLISNLGDSIYSIGATLLVYKLSNSSFYSGITLFLTSSTAIVQLILSPILDKINMKKFLVKSQLIQAFLLLIIPILYYFESLKVYQIMAIMPIISLINQLVYPGQISLLPQILPEDKLIRANSLMTMAYQGANAIFDSLAGFIISILGFMVGFYIDSLTFIITTILFSFLSEKIVRAKNLYGRERLIKNHIRELKNAMEIFENPIILSLILGIVFINFSATAIGAVLPAFSKDEVFYSLVVSSMGLGVFLGSLFSSFSFFKKISLGKLYTCGIFLVGIFWLIFPMSYENKFLALALYGAGWFIVGLVNVYGQTMVQILVCKEKIASAMGVMIGISSFMAPFGALVGGWMGDFFGSFWAIFFASLIVIGVSIFWTLSGNIRKLPRIDKIHKDL